jgi:S-phase kinase-associated protein 1
MTQVLEYCEHHRGEPLPTTDAGSQSGTYEFHEISEWDQKFIAVESETLYELVVAANNLDIEPLLLALILGSFGISDFLDSDLTAETAFNMVKGKRPEEARKILRM